MFEWLRIYLNILLQKYFEILLLKLSDDFRIIMCKIPIKLLNVIYGFWTLMTSWEILYSLTGEYLCIYVYVYAKWTVVCIYLIKTFQQKSLNISEWHVIIINVRETNVWFVYATKIIKRSLHLCHKSVNPLKIFGFNIFRMY